MEDAKDKENRAKEKYIETLKMEGFLPEENKKKCFIITPIGDEDSEIRRHIDGIIDAAIRPALDARYDVNAAHHIKLPGNITKQIIREIYESDLVVANLTNRNPNVMYELALRHCIGSPVIMIAERSTNLPSDIISERTIFYRNDAKGVLELKEQIKQAEEKLLQAENQDRMGPIYEELASIIQEDRIIKNMESENETDVSMLAVLLQRIDGLDRKITENQKWKSIKPIFLENDERRTEISLNANFEQCEKIYQYIVSHFDFPKQYRGDISFWADDNENKARIFLGEFPKKFIPEIRDLLVIACDKCGVNPAEAVIMQ